MPDDLEGVIERAKRAIDRVLDEAHEAMAVADVVGFFLEADEVTA